MQKPSNLVPQHLQQNIAGRVNQFQAQGNRGSNATVTAAAGGSSGNAAAENNNNQFELLSSLKKETLLLRDELRVREQMIIATANMLHRANEELMLLRTMKEKREEENAEGLLLEVNELKQKLATKEQTMLDWREKVKEAIKENKRRQQEQDQENHRLQQEILELQSQNRELIFLKRTREHEREDKEVQTVPVDLGRGGGGQSDFSSVEARLGGSSAQEVKQWVLQAENAEKAKRTGSSASVGGGGRDGSQQHRPLTVILTPPSRLRRRNNSSSVGGNDAVISPSPLPGGKNQQYYNEEETPHQQQHQQQQNVVGSPLQAVGTSTLAISSPPPSIPELPQSELANAPPIIVSIFYGTEGGWSVDTKLRVEPGQTVSDLITITCERVNQRYGKNLDCSMMCLRTHHPRAQRWVTIRDHRSVHSFAYFLRCATQSDPIKLQLEQLSAAEIARRSASAARSQQRLNNNNNNNNEYRETEATSAAGGRANVRFDDV